MLMPSRLRLCTENAFIENLLGLCSFFTFAREATAAVVVWGTTHSLFWCTQKHTHHVLWTQESMQEKTFFCFYCCRTLTCVPCHPMPSDIIPCHPVSYHPIHSHPISSHPLPYQLIPSHFGSSNPNVFIMLVSCGLRPVVVLLCATDMQDRCCSILYRTRTSESSRTSLRAQTVPWVKKQSRLATWTYKLQYFIYLFVYLSVLTNRNRDWLSCVRPGPIRGNSWLFSQDVQEFFPGVRRATERKKMPTCQANELLNSFSMACQSPYWREWYPEMRSRYRVSIESRFIHDRQEFVVSTWEACLPQ